ncbi:hypothetical protein K523DRAFT_166665 [Schizophyllum commune Tattone D]|nr:hypothetical protein K523DRAFT_166665 [Schizophyllum commune Tattone D]
MRRLPYRNQTRSQYTTVHDERLSLQQPIAHACSRRSIVRSLTIHIEDKDTLFLLLHGVISQQASSSSNSAQHASTGTTIPKRQHAKFNDHPPP